MPRYSTASGSEDSDFPSQLGPPSPAIHQLNRTYEFKLPFGHANPTGNPGDRDDRDERDDRDDSEEEGAWDEVDIPNQPLDDPTALAEGTAHRSAHEKPLEIVIRRAGEHESAKNGKKKSTALTPHERQLRQERHKVHVMSLLAMGLVRNRWLNDKELQARLISQLPSHIHASLVSITREKYPNPRDRSRLFEACLKDLTSWWYQTFEVVPGRELKRKGLAEVEEELKGWREELARLSRKEHKSRAKDKGKGKEKHHEPTNYKEYPWEEEEQLSYDKRKKRLAAQEKQKPASSSAASSSTPPVRPYNASSSTWEPVSSISTLYAAAANLRGSKDLSAQLFVALLRGLDVPARLVVSLQGVEWRSDSASGLTKKENARGKAASARGQGKSTGKSVETIELSSSDSEEAATGWEDGRGKLKYKVPKPNLRRSAPSQKKMASWQKEKMMMRSPSPDGSAHDITPRYSKSYTNTTAKLRVPTSSKAKKDNGGKDWFAALLQPWGRKYQLNRDKIEEEELWHRSRNEPFPTSFGGFKNHPNFVLEQHLHRDEALVSGTKPLGLFKSTTPVFPRSAVLVVKSTENWYRIGRAVKDGEVPRKFVKGRAVTINSKRREELIKLDGGEVDDQPLYSEDQTEVYVPDPVVDGKVPKNSFGNIDLFVPSMLPEGSVHLPSKLAVKCAKMLQIDHAEAIIGFEFRQRRANPTMSGIVVAREHAETLRQAIANLEQQTLEKDLAQQQDRVFKRWKKLITGLRIRQRLQGQFKDVESGIVGEAASHSTSATGTPRVDTSASNSPAPQQPRSTATQADNGISAARKRSSRSRRSPSPPTSEESSPSFDDQDYDQRPPPRKRITRSTIHPRSTRSKAGAVVEPPASDTSLKIRLPALAPGSNPGGGGGRASSTRASALKAKQNFLAQRDEGENEDEDGERNQYVGGAESDRVEPRAGDSAEATAVNAAEESAGEGANAGHSGDKLEDGTEVETVPADEAEVTEDGDEDYGFEYESE
ncbi:hypothetical protein JCM11491_001286 [Sporobolomyces phaffii]